MQNKKVFSDNLILSMMSKSPMTPAAIAERIGSSPVTIARALPRLYEDGLVEKIVIGSVHGKKITGWYTELSKKKRKQELRG
jgi:DNA-binding transcriptional ArsR family regulator